MIKIDFSEQDLLQEVTWLLDFFIEQVIGGLFNPLTEISTPLYQWVEDYQPPDRRPADQSYPFAMDVALAAYEYAAQGRWDEARGCSGEMMPIMDTLWQVSRMPLFIGPRVDRLDRLGRISLARWALDEGESLTLEQIAILAQMSLGSVKNALYGSAPDRLTVNEEGKVDNALARRWLGERRNFQPTVVYDSRQQAEGALDWLHRLNDVVELIRWRCRTLEVEPKIIARILSPTDPDPKLTELIDKGGDELVERLPALLTVDTCVELARRLGLDPRPFTERCLVLVGEERRQQELSAARRRLNRLLEAQQDATIDPLAGVAADTPLTAVLLRQLLMTWPGLRPHPKFRPGNAKMDAYLTETGRAIAHEHNQAPQFLWTPVAGLPKGLENQAQRHYPAGDSRHSGLKKYSELANAALARFRPETFGEAKQLLEVFVQCGVS